MQIIYNKSNVHNTLFIKARSSTRGKQQTSRKKKSRTLLKIIFQEKSRVSKSTDDLRIKKSLTINKATTVNTLNEKCKKKKKKKKIKKQQVSRKKIFSPRARAK